MYKVVLVPFPLTPLAAFGYHLCRKLKMISPTAACVYHWRPGSGMVRKAWQSDEILVLTGNDLRDRLLKLIRQSYQGLRHHQHVRMLNILAFPGNTPRKNDVYQLSNELSANWHSPEPALKAADKLFSHLLKFKRELQHINFPLQEIPTVSYPTPPQIAPSQFHFTLPLFDDAPAPLQNIIGFESRSLIESNAAKLMGHHLALVIGGPSSSGKSTATATVVDEINNLIKSLKSRTGWSEFGLSVKYVNLDKGTPVGQFILDQRGQDSNLLKKAKRPWTEKRARAGLRDLIAAKQAHNIVVADLPGKIDNLTRILSCGADGSIIITRDWSKMDEWKSLFGEMGLPHLAQAFTRLPQDGMASTVKRYNERILSGRISGLERTVCSWDPFLNFLAKALLFDILPRLVEFRQRAILNARHNI